MSESSGEQSRSTLLQAIAELFGDYADLVQKEIRLARAEIEETMSRQLRAGAFIGAAGFLGLIAVLLIVEGIVFAIASAGLALHWSCFIVAILLIAGACALYFQAKRSRTSQPLLGRSLEQIRRDIRTVKEQPT